MTTLAAPSTAPAKPEPTTTLLFGGIDLRSPPGPNNELFAFELLKPKEGSDSGGIIEWTRIAPDEVQGAFPAPRWRHTATAISKTQLLIFGGFRDSTTRLNDLHVYDHANKTWTQPVSALPPVAGEGAHFRRVKKAQAQQKAVVLATSRAKAGDEEEKKQEGGGAPAEGAAGGGGNKSTSFLEDLGVPLNDPQAQDGNPNAPTPRGAHSATLIGDYLYIFGGYGAFGAGSGDDAGDEAARRARQPPRERAGAREPGLRAICSSESCFRRARSRRRPALVLALARLQAPADVLHLTASPPTPSPPLPLNQAASATRAAISTTSTGCTCRR